MGEKGLFDLISDEFPRPRSTTLRKHGDFGYGVEGSDVLS